MHASDTATLEYHLRRLDGDRLAALVADLWAARGYETTREGDTVLARHGGETVHIWIPRATTGTRSRSGSDPADVVVACGGEAGDAGDARVVDAATLAEMLGYAVDRSVTRELCERHLGAAPAALSDPPLARAKRSVTTALDGVTATARDRTAPTLLAGTVAVAVVFAALLWFGAVPFAGELVSLPGEADGEQERVVTPNVPTDEADVQADTDLAINVSEPEPFPSSPDTPPPGVTAEGITDLEALASAHEEAMANRSHTIWLDRYSQQLNANGSRVQHDIDMRAADGRYQVTTTRIESDTRQRLGTVYYDGTVPYGAVWNETTGEYGRVIEIDPRHDLAPTPETVRKTAVSRYLSTEETNVTRRTTRGGTTLYRVVGTGQPNSMAFDNVWNYTVVAVVDSRGYVRDVTVEFTARSGGRTYRLRHEITYDRVGSTTIEPPWWYERHHENATIE